ncbi:MAG: DNA polymerase III subunit chi, partial [Gammaproteobacteria bacterium]
MEFYKAGTSLDEGEKFCCQFTKDLYWQNIESDEKNYIVINCEDLNQAKKLDDFLWENISDIFLPHKICNDLDSPDAPILISFPGIKHPCNKNTYLINLNPKLPSNFQDFKSSYQLVIEDEQRVDFDINGNPKDRVCIYQNWLYLVPINSKENFTISSVRYI